jgi:hypothetical protein
LKGHFLVINDRNDGRVMVRRDHCGRIYWQPEIHVEIADDWRQFNELRHDLRPPWAKTGALHTLDRVVL